MRILIRMTEPLNRPIPFPDLGRAIGPTEPIRRLTSSKAPVPTLDGRVTVTVEEAASLLGLGRSAAYVAVQRGEIPSRRLGRRLVVPVPALLEWLGATAAATTAEG